MQDLHTSCIRGGIYVSEHNHSECDKCAGANCCDAHSSCGCCHEHTHEHGEENGIIGKVTLAASMALLIISFIPFGQTVRTIIAAAAVVISAYPIVFDCFMNISNIKKFRLSETELMTITILAACLLGEFREAAAVAILNRIGEMLEDIAVQNSRKSIDALSKIQQDFAHLVMPDGSISTVNAESVAVGSEITVLPNERFPIDGIVKSGASTADASAITGESLPINLEPGVEIKSGMMNGAQSVNVITTCEFAESTASRIIQMVEEAAEKKGNTQRFITKFAKYYTPIVVLCAVLLAVIPSIITKDYREWIYRALVFLAASCPCAIIISVPLGFYRGLGAAAKNGILVKGAAYIEAVAKAKVFAFDKTGTLTNGEFEIEKITPCDGFTEEQVLAAASAAEHFSTHPLGKSIAALTGNIDESVLSDFEEIAGKGVAVKLCGRQLYCGGTKLMAMKNIDIGGLPVDEIYVAESGRAIGSVKMKSFVRQGAKRLISELKKQGIAKTVMLTGDSDMRAREVVDECGLDGYYSELTPKDKTQQLEKLREQYGKTVYVGDGINDAPVLAMADAGVAMGLGAQAATEAADIILADDSLERLAETHRLFKRTVATVNFNIVFALAFKLVVLVLGIFGLAPMWLAVLSDVGICLLCVLISSFIGVFPKKK